MTGFYAGIDIYLNTSLHEGIPMSVLEAMAHGLPVVAPAVGGIVEIIEDGVEGFLVEGRSPQAFAKKCILLQDGELRLKMGRAARARVEKAFSAQAMAQEYYRLYRELAAQWCH
jgi:glycosyltransferase involved in cell wall biosynthesis